MIGDAEKKELPRISRRDGKWLTCPIPEFEGSMADHIGDRVCSRYIHSLEPDRKEYSDSRRRF
jgi:hypothetical protein